MEYEIILPDETIFAKGAAELKATLKQMDTSQVVTIWKNIKGNGTCEDVTYRYIKKEV